MDCAPSDPDVSLAILNPSDLSLRVYSTCSGHAVSTRDGNYLAVYNLSTGIDLYQMPLLSGTTPVRTFPLSTVSGPLRAISLVSAAKGGEIIVGGGPDGRLNVFDRRTGLCVASLPAAPPTAFVQVVTVGVRRTNHALIS